MTTHIVTPENSSEIQGRIAALLSGHGIFAARYAYTIDFDEARKSVKEATSTGPVTHKGRVQLSSTFYPDEVVLRPTKIKKKKKKAGKTWGSTEDLVMQIKSGHMFYPVFVGDIVALSQKGVFIKTRSPLDWSDSSLDCFATFVPK